MLSGTGLVGLRPRMLPTQSRTIALSLLLSLLPSISFKPNGCLLLGLRRLLCVVELLDVLLLAALAALAALVRFRAAMMLGKE